jgi:hypothetical protein
MMVDFEAPFQKFTKGTALVASLHPFDSQVNEAMNNSVTIHAPKTRHYSKSPSIDRRVACAVGKHNLGQLVFFARVARKLGCELGISSRNGLDALTKNAAYQKKYQSSLKFKSRRKHKGHTSLPEAVAQRSRPMGIYSSGSSVAAENAHAALAAGASASEPATRAKPSACKACGKQDYVRRTSHLCAMQIKRDKRAKPAEPIGRVV